MKTAAITMTILGGIASIVIYWVSFIALISKTPAFASIPGILTLLTFFMLIIYCAEIGRGEKTGAGIIAILFCCVIGGILTLCIPESELVDKEERGEDDDEEALSKQQKYDKFEEIRKYKALLDDEIITQEEFDRKKKELL